MVRLRSALFLTLISLALACRGQHTMGPSPIPTPTPTATPSPQARPLEALSASGGRFYAGGRPMPLAGAIICCYDPYTIPHGWSYIDDTALDDLAASGANYTHVRTGPSSSAPPLDLLEPTVQAALERRIYVEVDVIDGWAIRTGRSPLGPSCEVLRAKPSPQALAWVREVVERSGAYPNVIYQVGNENFTCDVSANWELAIRDEIRRSLGALGMPNRLIGTNSQRSDLEDDFDYAAYHDPSRIHGSGVPVLINEYRSLSPEQYRDRLNGSYPNGVYFQLWRGPMPPSEWERALSYLGAFRTNHPI